MVINRMLLDDLLAWKTSNRRQPLLLQGTRQVGKTYTLKEFAGRYYRNLAYFNFEEEPSLNGLFADSIDPERIIRSLSLAGGVPIEEGDTLLFFDEIQESNRALSSLKYFAEKRPGFHVVAAGSLLGVALSGPGSFPVGKVDLLTLHPLSFAEFLDAMGETDLRRHLQGKADFQPLPEILHRKLIDLLKSYFVTGGMPACVAAFLEGCDGDSCRRIQKNILLSYERDFAKHMPGPDIPKAMEIWSSIPAQLSKENKKFFFSLVRDGARARSYEDALSWLVSAGLLVKAKLVGAPRILLSSYSSPSIFKTYMVDVGLLGAHSALDPAAVLSGSRLFTEFSGSLTENYVGQQLTASGQEGLFYWASSGEAEVDFLIQSGSDVLPLEVKAGESVRSMSLRSYRARYDPRRAFRTSLRNFREDGAMVNVPLYAAGFVPRYASIG